MIENKLVTYDIAYKSFDETNTPYFLVDKINHPILGLITSTNQFKKDIFKYDGYDWFIDEMYFDGKVQLKRFEDLDVDGHTQKFRRWIYQTI